MVTHYAPVDETARSSPPSAEASAEQVPPKDPSDEGDTAIEEGKKEDHVEKDTEKDANDMTFELRNVRRLSSGGSASSTTSLYLFRARSGRAFHRWVTAITEEINLAKVCILMPPPQTISSFYLFSLSLSLSLRQSRHDSNSL